MFDPKKKKSGRASCLLISNFLFPSANHMVILVYTQPKKNMVGLVWKLIIDQI